MESDNEFRLSLLEGGSDSPPPAADGSGDVPADSVHTNGVSGFANGANGNEAVAAEEAGAGEAEGAGEPMELEDPIGSPVQDANSYIGDNCLSTPANTESNSPQMADSEGMAEGEGDGEGGELEPGEMADASPDQSVSSNTPADQGNISDLSLSKGDLPLIADVASSDDVSPADVSSGSADILQTAGISSSTLDNSSSAISSSAQPESEDLLCSSSAAALGTNLAHLVHVNSAADTSALSQVSQQAQSLHYGQQAVTNSAHTAVSSSNISLLNQQVSSTCSDLGGGEDSAVSSSVGSNGSVGAGDATDALATLASAALNRQHSQELKPEKDEEPWFTVGIVKGTTFTVQNYLSDPNLDLSGLTIDNLPDLSGLASLPLEPGTGYKFRVSAINSCGRGDFGEESAFKTCVPGYPGAPSDIKISKSAEGAHLSWEPPQASPEGIFEYSVYLAVRPANPVKETTAKSQLTFVRVYCGKATTCVVAQGSLTNAHVDSSTKPAIIFRIAARNEKGYGPATQVRWLQENKASGVKRILSDGRPPGAPPSKQQKPLMH